MTNQQRQVTEEYILSLKDVAVDLSITITYTASAGDTSTNLASSDIIVYENSTYSIIIEEFNYKIAKAQSVLEASERDTWYANNL